MYSWMLDFCLGYFEGFWMLVGVGIDLLDENEFVMVIFI